MAGTHSPADASAAAVAARILVEEAAQSRRVGIVVGVGIVDFGGCCNLEDGRVEKGRIGVRQIHRGLDRRKGTVLSGLARHGGLGSIRMGEEGSGRGEGRRWWWVGVGRSLGRWGKTLWGERRLKGEGGIGFQRRSSGSREGLRRREFAGEGMWGVERKEEGRWWGAAEKVEMR